MLVTIADRVEKRRNIYTHLQGGKTYIYICMKKNECEEKQVQIFLASTLLIMIELIKHNSFAHHDNFGHSNTLPKCEHILNINIKQSNKTLIIMY